VNHLGDTNKMVDTPRMDASAHDDGAIWQTGCQLERELTAANYRIKRLEEAGDAVAAIIGPPGSAHWADENQVDAAWTNWNKAKEAKP
jgi:hypothetical protein